MKIYISNGEMGRKQKREPSLFIFGGQGNDLLKAGTGDDTLYGGEGSMNVKRIRIAWAMHLFLASLLLAITPPVWAGKYPYAEFLPTLSYATVEILKKHGMPVAHDRDNPWAYSAGIPGSYTLKFHRADEIPQQAVLDIVKLCMDFYEQRGRKERFRIVMYHASHKEWRKSLFLGIGGITTMKPFFELTIGRKE